MQTVLRTLVQVAVIATVVGLSVFAARHLMATRPEAKRARAAMPVPLVETLTVAPASAPVRVRAMGTVGPARTVTVASEVGGRVVSLHPQLVAGGRVAAGDELVRIDPRDYELAVEQQRGAVARARFELKVEQGRQAVAEREWQLVGESAQTTPAGRDLARRVPHLDVARATLAAAQKGLERAELSLLRTTIAAPFNAVVLAETVEVGQLVAPPQPLATLVGTDEFWVEVLVPAEMLRHLRIPGVNASEGARATVEWSVGDQPVRREGEVVRLLGDLDAKGRMARLIVSVADPLGVGSDAADLPLLLGTYVAVALEGDDLPDVHEIPRVALREGAQVWTVTRPPDGAAESAPVLAIHDVSVVFRERERVFVRGLPHPAEVIVSRLAAPVAGMAVRRAERPAGPAVPPAATAPRTAATGPETPRPAEARP